MNFSLSTAIHFHSCFFHQKKLIGIGCGNGQKAREANNNLPEKRAMTVVGRVALDESATGGGRWQHDGHGPVKENQVE